MTTALEVKKEILAAQVSLKRSRNNEERLERELGKFFTNLKKEVLAALDEYWSDYQMLKGHIDLICAPVHISHKDYYEILRKYKLREYKLGQAEAKRLYKLSIKKDKHASKSTIPVKGYIKRDNDLFATHKGAEEVMLNKTFVASDNTLNRVDGQINQIITDGYRSGKGINDVADQLTRRFDQLADWESRRIARTEIHGAHNQAVYDQYGEMGVEYTMWSSVDDGRTRGSKPSDTADHLVLNGEIIRVGDRYSNGLMFPGDTSGPIEEWINCRCSNAPFVMPWGKMAPPGMEQFRVEDLVDIEAKPKDFDELINNATEEAQTHVPHLPKVEGYNRYALNETQQARLAELEAAADHLGFKDKKEYKKLKDLSRYNELHNKQLVDGSLEFELQKEFKQIERRRADEIIELFGVPKESEYLPITAEERQQYKELKEQEAKGELGFLGRSELNEINAKMEFNEYYFKYKNKLPKDAEIAKKYKSLVSELHIDNVIPQTVDEFFNIQKPKAAPQKPKPKPEVIVEKYKGQEFRDYTEVIDDLDTHMNEVQSKVKYKEKHKTIVRNYGAEYYDPINDMCYGNPTLEQSLKNTKLTKKQVKEKIRELDEAIEMSPGLDDNYTLWSGGDSRGLDLTPGARNKWDAYRSTSFDRNVAEDFKDIAADRIKSQGIEDAVPVLFKIRAKKGTEGVYLDDNLQATPGEYEYLLARATEWETVSYDPNTGICEIEIII